MISRFKAFAAVAFVAVLTAHLIRPPACPGADVIARDSYRKGRDLYNVHGDAAGAERLLSHAVARDSSFREAYLLLGSILMETGQPARALELAERGLVYLPGDEDLLAGQAEALASLGRTAQAAAIRDRFAAEKRDPLLGAWVAALVAKAAGDYPEEERALVRALALDPRGDLKARLLAELAAVRERVGDLEGARAAQRDRLAARPGVETTRAYLAFLARHDLGGAELVSKAGALLEAKKPDPGDYAFLSQGHLLEGRADEAVFAAARGLAMGGAAERLEVQLARGYLALGRPRLALEHLDRAAAAGAAAAALEGYRLQARAARELPATGPAIAIQPARWEVGEIEDGQVKRAEFQIANNGREPLRIFTFWVRGVPRNALAVTSPEQIPAGGTAVIAIEARGAGGPFSLAADVIVLSNDTATPAAAIRITGKFLARPRVILATDPPSPLDLGKLTAGTTVVREFRVFNRGDKALTISQLATSVGVTCEGLEAGLIQPGGEKRLVMRWTPPLEFKGPAVAKVGLYSGDLPYGRGEIALKAFILSREGDEKP